MLNDAQRAALNEIERQVSLIRISDQPCPSNVIPVVGNLQKAIDDAPEWAILDLLGNTFVEAVVVNKPLNLRNGTIQAPPNCNDVVILRESHIVLNGGLIINGDGTTKRGIMNDAMFVEIDNIQVRNIRRAGQESQAIAMWNTPGPLKVTNSVLEAGSIPFLAGGNPPVIPNTIATGLLFENCLFTRPVAWQGQAIVCKNAFELKSAQDVVVRNCTLENVWKQGQTASAIVLTAVNYGNSPDAVVQNVLFENCNIRNVGAGVNGIGYGQHTNDAGQVTPTRQGNNWKFINCNWEISMARNGGTGALVMLGREPKDIHFDGGVCVQDGGAFLRQTEPMVPINDFSLQNMTIKPVGTYGVFTPIGSRGVGWNTAFPGGVIAGNTLYGAHSLFKTNFPNNTYAV